MSLQRLSVKFFARQPETVDPAAFTPVFQRWIQEHSVEGLLIDVADYRHVHEGPGVILIGHEADYALDLNGGRPGLLYVRKRDVADDLRQALGEALRLAVRAAQRLEADVAVGGLAFDPAEVVITFLDRLNAPNRRETVDLVRADVEAALAGFYGDRAFDLEIVHEDPRYPFALRVTAPGAPEIAALAVREAVSG